MPNVLNEFAGDGVTRTFNFSMTGGYLSRDYVYFFIRPNDDLLNYTPYNDDDVTWLTDFSVRTASPIPVGTTFVILRSTTLDPLVDFQKTSRITEKNLDTATWQSIHIAAETSDTVGRIHVVATNAKKESATALAGAQAAAADAVTAAESAVAASVAASSAQAAALQASTEAAGAAKSAASAASTAVDAQSVSAQARDTANTAAATANAALADSSAATATANTAASQAAAAVGTANTALSTANSASTAASSAVSTANSASSTAGTAMTVANEAKALIDEAVSGAVVSFNGRAGVVSPQAGDYTKYMVGLSNVDNTADLDKPLSTAVNNALGMKADKSYTDTHLATKASATDVTNALALKADQSYVTNALAANSGADRNRANHTGSQDISTVTGLESRLDAALRVRLISAVTTRSFLQQIVALGPGYYRLVGNDTPEVPIDSAGVLSLTADTFMFVVVDYQTGNTTVISGNLSGLAAGSWKAQRLSGESGSNASGTYIKHPSGIMECWAQVTMPAGVGANDTRVWWSFPAQFTSVEYISANPIRNAMGSGSESGVGLLNRNGVYMGAISVTGATFISYPYTAVNDQSVSLAVCAKGRWR